ncbi:MAG: CCA tRNA nucleotidyltransferase [Saccharofermentanales bacterium]
MILPEQIFIAIKTLEQNGYEAFVVGGSVRDALMGADPKDFDIATNANPENLKKVFRDVTVIETGIAHGTVTVLIEATPIEITTFRIDGEYLDKRRPVSVEFSDSIIEDLARRDFTINAMAYSAKTGIIDPFGGQDDIANKIIRCVGDPSKRFEEDALRIFRAIRFASVLGFEIEPATRSAIMDKTDTILSVAIERITAEFSRMICGHNIGHVMKEYRQLLAVIIPEIEASFDFEQQNFYHVFDVYTHTCRVVSNSPPFLVPRLAAFFHDIAKPFCFTKDEKGSGHFYGHQQQSARMAGAIMNRMKFDNETKRKTADLIENHDIDIDPEPKAIKKILNKFSEEFFIDLIALKKADVLGQNPELKGRSDALDELMEIYIDIVQDDECFSLKKLAVKGDDLLAAGVPKGNRIGLILEDCLHQVMSDRIKNDKEELMGYVKTFYLENSESI